MGVTQLVLFLSATVISIVAGFSDNTNPGNILPSFGPGSISPSSGQGLVYNTQGGNRVQESQIPATDYQPGAAQNPGTSLQRNSIPGSSLSGPVFPGNSMQGTSFTGNSLQGSNFPRTSFQGSSFPANTLKGRDLMASGFPGTNFQQNSFPASSQKRGSTLNDFGPALGSGAAGLGFQRGTAQVSSRNQANSRAKEELNKQQRHFDNADVGAARKDTQDRKGDLRENAFQRQQNQAQGNNSHETRSYDENLDKASENGKRQLDLNDKHGSGLESVGRFNRKDVAENAGDKALSAKRNAFAQENKGYENVDYAFKKDFDTIFNERGGFKEAVGQDNLNSDVYEENQRDNRFSKGLLDAFRRSSDKNAFRKEADWASNAAQRKNINNKYGAADKLQNVARNQHADWTALFDRRNDVLWNRDSAQDKALRSANDVAEKKAGQQKKALAQASGNKGVQDNKYYGGGNYGSGAGANANANLYIPSVGLGTGAAGVRSGTGNGGYTNTARGPVTGSGIVSAGNAVGAGRAGPGNLRGRQEGSGGDYVNQYREKARQADLADQKQSSLAQSDAKALNDYNRGRGVNDSIEVNGQREGKWLKDSAGLKDAKSQGFNGADASAAKNSSLADRNVQQRVSNSNLQAANKNMQAQELDRLNFKKNQVDSEQKVRKEKKFYHDKNEGGFNNEALKFLRDSDNKETGEEQHAQKAAQTSFNNAADDSKVNQRARAYNNLDARHISKSDAFARAKDNSAGWKNEDRRSDANAVKNKANFEAGRQSSEFDDFARNINNRNQRLWDQARKDQAQRQHGSETNKAVDAAFLFGPQNGNNALGLGSGRQTPFGGGYVGGGSTPFSSSARFGGSRGSGSSFGGGFNSPLGGFMDDIGSSKFGSFGFGGSPSGSSAYGGSGGGMLIKGNSRQK